MIAWQFMLLIFVIGHGFGRVADAIDDLRKDLYEKDK